MPGIAPSTEPVLVKAKSSAGVHTVAVAILLAVFSQRGNACRMTTVFGKQTPAFGWEPSVGSIRSTDTCALNGPALPVSEPMSRATYLIAGAGVADQPLAGFSGLFGSKVGSEPAEP